MRRGEITERIDPKFIYYGGHQEIQAENKNLLGALVLQEPDYGAAERAVAMLSPDDTKYIRITDYGEDGIEPSHEFVTAESVDDRFLLEDEDILFARSGATAGKTFIYKKDVGKAIFAGYCIRFRFDKEKVLPKYVYFYTKTLRYAAWVNSMQRAAGQPNINKEEYKSFVIPLPDLKTQRALVAEMESARAMRQSKLAEAESLLTGIDGFVLDELGFKVSDKKIKGIFAVKLNKAKTGRLDVENFLDEIRNKSTIKGSYPNKRLADVSKIIMGQAPQGKDYNDEEKGLPLIAGAADLEDVYPSPQKWTTVYPKKSLPNDIILCIRATIGTLNWSDKEYCLGRGVAGIRPDKSLVDENYLYEALSLRRHYLLSRGTGSTFKQVTSEEIENCPIPIPPLDVQKKIAAELQRRRAQARQLREEAESVWQKAKEEFERKLLT